MLVLFIVIASYVGPSLHVFESWRESKGADARLAELKSENAELTRKAKALESDASMMAEARKLGMVAPPSRRTCSTASSIDRPSGPRGDVLPARADAVH